MRYVKDNTEDASRTNDIEANDIEADLAPTGDFSVNFNFSL